MNMLVTKRHLLLYLLLVGTLLVPAQEIRGRGRPAATGPARRGQQQPFERPQCGPGMEAFSRCICALPDNFFPGGYERDVTCKEAANLTQVPEGRPGIIKLTFSGTGISRVSAGDFSSYPDVTELFIRDEGFRPCLLEELEAGAFDDLISLKTLALSGCPRLTSISAGVLGTFRSLETLKIYRNGLTTVPDLSRFVTLSIDTVSSLKELDLHNNQIEAIETSAFSGVRIGTLNLEGNHIEYIEGRAFSNSTIVDMRIKGNVELKTLSPDAFSGLSGLRNLDMSATRIDSLPTAGIESLKTLLLKNTPSLKQFPTVLVFKSLVKAELTYPHHCCAFKNPDKQDPTAWKAKQAQEKAEVCVTTPPNSLSTTTPDSSRGGVKADIKSLMPGVIVIHEEPVKIDNTTKIVDCGGNYFTPIRNVSCTPEPDAFNPCEDVMGYAWLRVTIWFVLLAALLGNSVVLLVLIKSHGKFTVPKFLMCNLAFADFVMGVYLILIASIDARTLGEYFNYAVEWQNEGGCQAAGFLSVFSSEFSIFSLMIITLERWYAISHAIHLNKRLKMRHSVLLMILACGFAVALAVLPIVGVSGYGHVSICLPMKVENELDVAYLVFILVLNGVVFLAICLCYLDMYWKVKKSATNARNNDTRIAKRMALLVLTNFACWAPIAFFGLTASAGEPLIDITNSKILLVFFYPLNSCANPFLYAIFTKQFRKDVFIILGKNGLCVEQASKYRVTYTSRSLSQSRGNKDIAIHGLHHHRSESLFSHLPDNNHTRNYSVSTPPKVHPTSHVRPENGIFQSFSHAERTTEVTYRPHGSTASAGSLPNADTGCTQDTKRPPYVRSVSDYINFDPKRYHPSKSFPKEQKSIETYISNSTDTTCVSDYSHGTTTTDEIWKIRENDAETEFSVADADADADDYYNEDGYVEQKLFPGGAGPPPGQEMKTFSVERRREKVTAADDAAICCPLLERVPVDGDIQEDEEDDIQESAIE